MPKRLLRGTGSHQGKVLQLADGASQIMVEVLVCPLGGENKVLKALIDTGAQINAVRRGLFQKMTCGPPSTH